MTGYGRGECAKGGYKFMVELNSVNRKQSDILINLPKELIELEPRMRDEINAKLSRGRINAVVVYHRAKNGAEDHVELDMALAESYLRAIRKLKSKLKLNGTLSLETVLNAPGVLRLSERGIDPEAVWPSVKTALEKALAAMVKMREKEGKHLAADLSARLDTLASGAAAIRQRAPVAVARFRETLQARIKEAGLDLPLDDDRLVKEVVFFADRCDISEELTRLDSHLQQFRDSLKAHEPVGRALDFLSQEVNRELNTIGSKANSVEIAQEVVKLKAELEKIREQVQNIE
jgi:uncharacterized protein (TIGR00255 family)